MYRLRDPVRKPYGRRSPSLGIIDSRNVRTSRHANGKECRVDGSKKIKEKKEHIVVDTLGFPMTTVIHSANIHDSIGAISVKQLVGQGNRIKI